LKQPVEKSDAIVHFAKIKLAGNAKHARFIAALK
jgi:hypothetical protein